MHDINFTRISKVYYQNISVLQELVTKEPQCVQCLKYGVLAVIEGIYREQMLLGPEALLRYATPPSVKLACAGDILLIPGKNAFGGKSCHEPKEASYFLPTLR